MLYYYLQSVKVKGSPIYGHCTNLMKGMVNGMATYHDGAEIDRAAHSINYTEFTVKKKTEGLLILAKLGLILLYVAIVVCMWVFAGWWLGAISIVLAAIIWFFTWPYVNIEYEYTTASGDLQFSKIYGGKKRKLVLEKKIKDMELIAPYTSEYTDKFPTIAKTYDFRKSVKQKEDVYFAVFDEGGEKHRILFQCTNKALKIFEKYNKENTVAVDTLHY